MKSIVSGAVIAGALLAVSVPAPAEADVIVGSPANTNNCIPFSCSAFNGANYQQSYSASSFSGTITVTGLAFFCGEQHQYDGFHRW
jgi:hypothetical protein